MKINSVGSATHVHWTFDTLLTTRGCDKRSVTAPVKCLLKFVEVSRLTLLQRMPTGLRKKVLLSYFYVVTLIS